MSTTRRALGVLVAVLLSAGACSGRDRPPAAARAPETTLVAPTTQLPTTAPPVTAPPVAAPVRIPADSYAPEPVVEIGTMEIPAIGLRHTIYQGVTLNNIDLGPSHWTGTPLPGQRGNTVFAGHRVSETAPFRHIDRLTAGDEVIFTVHGTRSVYRVNGSLIVEPRDVWIADPTERPTGTLYSCHPPGSLAYRYVVRMDLVPPHPA
jgi:sortase A